MAPPTADQVRAATAALRDEADVWDRQAGEMGEVVTLAEAMRLNRVQAGLFQLVFDTYTEVVNQVVDRSGEGVRRMGEVANTLRQVADTYEREEAANLHRIKGLY
ncbi:type VII secretion target [Crossiella cryophila]|uniref:Excreted virulence factor EspC, type VII ESX diderm n=1 Tax=Crossiella cryophila TaxID=43355 RepID=A0A7W7CCT4_9PSEU|nr:type VII secretion target [Crossiella cryophila]MBB4678792.1 hypothetical protein [Crossiella cryophila]